MKKITNKLSHFLLIVIIVLILIPTFPLKAYVAPTSTFNLALGTGTGSGWSWSGTTLTVNSGANVEITGMVSNGRCIAVAANATASITLKGVSITGLSSNQSPLMLNNGANVNLILVGDNTLTGGAYCAGIQAPAGTSLIITAENTDKLTVNGGTYSAGIGGGRNVSGGTITINGGTVIAKGSIESAGIGGGQGGSSGKITVSGGTVTATGGEYGAGMGGGRNGSGETIAINGGIITAKGGYGCVGIGGGSPNGSPCVGGAINIDGGTVTATGGLYCNVGIGLNVGSGIGTLSMRGNGMVFTSGVSDADISRKTSGILIIGGTTNWYGGEFTASQNTTIPNGYTLTISNGKNLTIPLGITLTNNGQIANSGTITNNGLIINSGTIMNAGTISGTITGNSPVVPGSTIDLSVSTPLPVGDSWTYSNNVYTILDGANVIITGTNANQRRIAVESEAKANIKLNSMSVTGLTNNQSALFLNMGAEVNLTLEGSNTVTAGYYCAGIQAPTGTTLTIVGSGSLAATGGSFGAGIGGGSGDAGGTINIGNGTITATGGNGGAGIGGGSGGSGGMINISGGTVNANGGRSGAGIGGGNGGIGGIINISGGAITAAGGNDVYSNGAGIGGGTSGAGGIINISSGVVTANGGAATGYGSFGAGIGGGYAGEVGAFSLNGNGVVFASSVSDTDVNRKANGILFMGNNGKVYGNVTLADNIVIPVDKTLFIPNIGTLTIPAGKTLTNNGKIVNGGTINGIIEGNQPIASSSTIDLNVSTPLPVGDGWTYANNVYTILDGADVIITGTSANGRRVEVAPGRANVTLNGVCITGLANNQSPFLLNTGAEANLTLEGVNTLTAGMYCAGIQAHAGTQLTLDGTGDLTATGGGAAAGIGGGDSCAGGTIIINGGDIIAISGGNGAGIGGGKYGKGGVIIINGGTVTATGSGYFGAGIGGGYFKAGGTITISGGIVTATGGNGGAGIGGGSGESYGDGGAGGTISIPGGTVTAKGGNNAAGIGGGRYGAGGEITISGGVVTASGNGNGASLGKGADNSDAGILVMSGNGIVFASSVSDSEMSRKTSGILITGRITNWYGNVLILGQNVTIPNDKTLTILNGKSLMIPTGKMLTNNGLIVNNGTITQSGTMINNGITLNIGTLNGTIEGNEPIEPSPIIDMSAEKPMPIGVGWTYSNSVYTILDGADIVIVGTSANQRRIEVASNATADVTLNGVCITALNDNQSPFFMQSGSEVCLTLQGDNTITAGRECAGMQVPAGTTLSITGESTGKLTVTGGAYNGAGIGGGISTSGGTITINGGTVIATGSGAGIGGGNGGTGGAITINGGTVTATGGSGAGIGGGNGRSGGIITINGGKVTAKSNGRGAGIGGGDDSEGGDITINGGTVTATGTDGGAGIGGGSYGQSGTISINGGIVTATGTYGIGGGYHSTTGMLRILSISGNAVVFASSVSDIDTSMRAKGILFEGNNGRVYGSVSLAGNITIPASHKLTVPGGAALTIPEGITLTNYGAVIPEDGSSVSVLGAVSGNKIKGANVTVLTLNCSNKTGVVLNDVSLLAETEQEVEYSLNTSCDVPENGWQSTPIFAGLTPDSIYYFFARSKENVNFQAGMANSLMADTYAAQVIDVMPNMDDTKLTVTFATSVNATFVIAFYDDIKLLKTYIEEAEESDTIFEDIPIPEGTTSIKVMIWNEINNMAPLGRNKMKLKIDDGYWISLN